MLRRGLKALMTAPGTVEAVRFLNLPRSRFPDYVEWHRQWQVRLPPQPFFDRVWPPAVKPSFVLMTWRRIGTAGQPRAVRGRYILGLLARRGQFDTR